MAPSRRAYIVGNVAVFDEEIALLGKLRFICFDDRGNACAAGVCEAVGETQVWGDLEES